MKRSTIQKTFMLLMFLLFTFTNPFIFTSSVDNSIENELVLELSDEPESEHEHDKVEKDILLYKSLFPAHIDTIFFKEFHTRQLHIAHTPTLIYRPPISLS